MKNNSLGFIAIISIVIISNGCGLLNRFKMEKDVDRENEYSVTYCDTILRQFYRYPDEFTPVISNIDPEIQVTPVTLGDLYCYQIEFKEIPLFRNYELWLDDIKFNFNLDSNSPDCSKVGDKIICLVDQIKLGNECSNRRYSDSKNKFDCIYKHRWNMKIRGVVCDSVYGPFSNSISNISLQCTK